MRVEYLQKIDYIGLAKIKNNTIQYLFLLPTEKYSRTFILKVRLTVVQSSGSARYFKSKQEHNV